MQSTIDWYSEAKTSLFPYSEPSEPWVNIADSINPYNPTAYYGIINEYLELNTFLSGHTLSINDIYLSSKLMKCPSWSKLLTSKTRPAHICRWFIHVFSLFPNKSFDFFTKRASRIDGRLVAAIEQNNMSLFEILLELVDLNARSPSDGGPRPIHTAALKANIKVLERLLEKGVDIETQDEEGLTPIFYAAQSKDIGTLQYLIDKGANLFHVEKQGRTLFYWAASLGNVQMLELLMKKGLDPNAKTILGRSALSKSAWNGNLEVLTYLLGIEGIQVDEPDKRGRTALHNAVWGCAGGREGRKMGQNSSDSPECATQLILKGCNIESVDNGGNTPLCIACSTYSPGSLKVLLSHNANKEHYNLKGYNPYHQALSRGNIKCAKIVLKSGFDINCKSQFGLAPVGICLKYAQANSLSWLFSQGILPQIDDIKLGAQRADAKTLELLLTHITADNLCETIIDYGNIECALWAGMNLELTSKAVALAISKDKKLGELVLNRWKGEIDIALLEAMIEHKIDTKAFLHRAIPTGRILRLAIKQGNLELSKRIIEDNQDLAFDADSFSGNTALHIACMSGMSEIIPKLIELSKDPAAYITQNNNKGLNSIVLAQVHKHLYISELLKDMLLQAHSNLSFSQVKHLNYDEVLDDFTNHPYAENMPTEYWESISPLTPIENTRCLWIDTVEALNLMLDSLKSVKVIGVDLEYHVFSQKKGCICVIQISTGCEDYVIDALINRTELAVVVKKLFDDPSILKVMHGVDSDLIWLQNDFDAHPVRVFDTARAYKLIKGDQMLPSLASLLLIYFDLKIDKSFQVAEWRIRPLPSPMLEYARTDSHYLPALLNKLLESLTPESLKLLSSQCNALCLKSPKTKVTRLRILP